MKLLITFLKSSSSAKDNGWSWVILFASFSISGFTWGVQNCIGVIYSVWLIEFQESKSTVAWVTSLPFSIVYLLSPIFPYVCKRMYGYQLPGFIGTIIMSSSLFCSSFVDNFKLLFLTHSVLLGIGLLLIANQIVLIIPKYFEKYASISIAIATVGSFTTPLFLSPMLSYLTEKYNWRVSFRILSLIVFCVCAPCSLLWKRHTSDDKFPRNNKIHTKYKMLMKNKRFFVLFIALVICSIDSLVSMTHIVQYAVELGVSRKNANLLPTCLAAGNIAGRILFGYIFDIQKINKLRLFKILMIVSGCIAFLGSYSTTFLHLVIFALSYATADGGYKAQYILSLLEVVDKSYLQEAWTVLLCGHSVFMVCGPVIVAFLSDLTQNYKTMFYLSAASVITSSLMLNFLLCVREEENVLYDNGSHLESNDAELNDTNNFRSIVGLIKSDSQYTVANCNQ